MAVNGAKITIVGCGPGSPAYTTEAARRAVAKADVLFGGPRLFALFPDGPADRIPVGTDIAAILEQIAQRRAAGRKIAVLVSGDPGLYSLSQSVIRRFGRDECEVVPAVSSVQVAFARLGLDWADARILSAHGQRPQVSAAELHRADKIAVLGGTRQSLDWASQMAKALETSHMAFLAENLTLDNERIQRVTPEQLAAIDAASLSIVLFIRGELFS